MAAVTLTTQSSTVLALDASRMRAALSWPAGISSSTLDATARALAPRTAPSVSLSGSALRVDASASATGAAARGLGNLELSAWVTNPQSGTAIVGLGTVHSGAFSYQGSIANLCPGGCRLAGLGLVPAVGHHAPSGGVVHLTVNAMAARSSTGKETPIAEDLSATDWRSSANRVRIGAGPGHGLTLVIPASETAAYTSALASAIPPMASVADHPLLIPGVVTSELESINGGVGDEPAPVPTPGAGRRHAIATPGGDHVGAAAPRHRRGDGEPDVARTRSDQHDLPGRDR